MKRPDLPTLLLFAVATFASAFLIFLVQPLVAKRILPWFGGAPAVWTLCLAFYQATLFAGYAYAHALVRFARPGVQVALHGLAVAAALAALPVLPDEAWRPLSAGSAPSSRILAMLAANVGAPFLVLAATGPLLQAWFARALPGTSPYPLYAVSNLGSMGAVAAYPFWVEPRFGVVATGTAWSWAFALTAAAVLASALLAWRRHDTAAPDPARTEASPGPGEALLWIALAGTAVMLLMGVTNELCLDVASVPFLWMLPLGLYLLSLVLCFGPQRSYRRGPWLALTGAAIAAPLFVDGLGLGASQPGSVEQEIFWQILRYGLLLLGGCMLLHGELYRLRPPPVSLTAYYLSIAGGGALGGLFVGLVTPWLFDDYHERPLALGLGWLALLAAFARNPGPWLRSRSSRGLRAGIAGLTVLALGVATHQALEVDPSVVHRQRNFYGLLRVSETPLADDAVVRNLFHGTTRHGTERSNRLGEPSSYYGRYTGIGLVFDARRRDATWNVGVVGLGVGTLAAYARPGDRFTFYEIDPAVVALARSHFHYLDSLPDDASIVEGDGRLALAAERESGAPRYDLLVLDAYSGDAMPVHMLTLEAVQLFADRIEPRGLLAFHVSNRSFDLAPLIARLGAELNLHTLVLDSPHLPEELSVRSIWVLLGRNTSQLDALARRSERNWRSLDVAPTRYVIGRPDPAELGGAPLWTDDYSDLFSALGRPGIEARRRKLRELGTEGPRREPGADKP